jgi:hypothetical protein
MKTSDLTSISDIEDDDLLLISDVSAHTSNKVMIGDIAGDIAAKVWKFMYEQPVIVICGHCGCHNIITNPACTQCGAPAKHFKKINP